MKKKKKIAFQLKMDKNRKKLKKKYGANKSVAMSYSTQQPLTRGKAVGECVALTKLM